MLETELVSQTLKYFRKLTFSLYGMCNSVPLKLLLASTSSGEEYRIRITFRSFGDYINYIVQGGGGVEEDQH